MQLHLTTEQLKALDRFNELHDTAWHISHIDDGTLEIVVCAGVVGLEFERNMAPDGTITRYDANTDRDELAGPEPEIDTTPEGRRWQY